MNENARILIFDVNDKTCIMALRTTGEDLSKFYLERSKRLPEIECYFSREIR